MQMPTRKAFLTALACSAFALVSGIALAQQGARVGAAAPAFQAVDAEGKSRSLSEFAGKTVIHVLADTRPGAGFEPVAGGLEDVYFSTLSASRKVAA